MKLVRGTLLLMFSGALSATTAFSLDVQSNEREISTHWSAIQETIERHLGRPYVWGASGLKSFDCSGFVWRVMYENGIRVKRTTARKFYMRLPKLKDGDPYAPGNIVFFNNLKHVGIVGGPSEFYHAQTSKGTRRSEFNSFWRARVTGFRAFPVREGKPPKNQDQK